MLAVQHEAVSQLDCGGVDVSSGVQRQVATGLQGAANVVDVPPGGDAQVIGGFDARCVTRSGHDQSEQRRKGAFAVSRYNDTGAGPVLRVSNVQENSILQSDRGIERPSEITN